MFEAQLLALALSALPAPSPAAPAPDVPCHGCSQTVWYVDASSTANGPGTSWATAFKRLPSAINAAAPGDCIWVASGVYTPTASGNRTKTIFIQKTLSIYGGFDGTELCLSQRAGRYWSTVLSGDIGVPGDVTDNSYQVVTVTGPVPLGQQLLVLLDGFRITGGYNDSGPGDGAGIYAFTGELTLRNCFLRVNEAKRGGGLFANGCKVALASTGFGRNVAEDGAGIYMNGGEVRAFNASFRKNVASKRGGGAFLVNFDNMAESVWANVLFEGNSAGKGGAMFVQDGTTYPPPKPWIYPGRAKLVGCTVTRNQATTLGPALVAIDHPILANMAGRLQVENTIVWNNAGPKPDIEGWIKTTVSTSVVPPGSPFIGPGNIPLDPLISPPYFRPGSGSPAIDAGSAVELAQDMLDLDGDGNVVEPTPYDWLGRARIQNMNVDIGASEY